MALAKTLMIQGTASHVGKSVLTAALCRIFKNRGIRVAPFKAQNMSNNSYVTPDGLEVARAQAVQAEACGLEPQALMSPILLKPESDRRSQVVVMGKACLNAPALLSKNYRKKMEPIVLDALQTLRSQYDLVVIEGAGSPAEINLKKNEIVNMRIARAARSPVILVGDIDAGGVFAQLVGTLALLTPAEQKHVRAFLINKFRGNLALLQPGLTWLERKTRKRVLGVVPYLIGMDLAEEDSLPASGSASLFSGQGAQASERNTLRIDVLRLPRLSNFTDFDRLAKRQDVALRWLTEPDRHCVPDVIFVPGTKSTMADLKYLRQSGLADYILRAAQAGSWIVGICGGYQMLGEKITDVSGVESRHKQCAGLGLIPAETVFSREKKTCRVRARHLQSGLTVEGYEIHMGETRVLGRCRPLFEILARNGAPVRSENEGVAVTKGKTYVFGTYLHGLFENEAFLHEFLNQRRIAVNLKPLIGSRFSGGVLKDDGIYDRLAEKVESALNMDFLLKMADI